MVARIVSTRTDAEVALADMYGTAKPSLPGNATVAAMREAAFDAFAGQGLPHRRIEAWHYTDLRNMMAQALPLAGIPDVKALQVIRTDLAAMHLPDGPRLVIVDGTYASTLSDPLPPGASIRSLADVLAEGRTDLIDKLSAAKAGADNAVVALNAAMMQDGVVIEVADGASLPEPIHIVYATATAAPAARFSRSLLVAGAGASVRLSEWSLKAGGRSGQTFGCLIVHVGDGADVRHTCAITRTETASLRIDTFVAELGIESKFDSFALVQGEGMVRRQLFMRCVGDRSVASLRGVSLLRGHDHADTTLDVEHIGLGCEGRETFRYVLDDAAVGIFQGRIRVAPGAQKTDGKMMSRALLLSDNVVMNNKPELEIFADDVACGHGATCGGLNEDQLFYMQARGIARADAEALLLEAFAAELADDIGHDGLTASFRAEMTDWLAARGVPLPA